MIVIRSDSGSDSDGCIESDRMSHAVKVDVVKRLKANKGNDTHKPPLPKR